MPKSTSCWVVICVGASLVTTILRAAELDALQGQWLTRKTNELGQAYGQKLQIQKDQVQFEILDGDGTVRFLARGTINLEARGPIDTMDVRNMSAGATEAELSAVEATLTTVYKLKDGVLYVAANFERDRDNQIPRFDLYRRPSAWPAQPESELGGTWNFVINLEGQDLEYDLRLHSEGGKWTGTLVSPRSGPHDLDKVEFVDGTLKMTVDRKLGDAEATFSYEGKMTGAKQMKGTFRIEAGDNRMEGTWHAEK